MTSIKNAKSTKKRVVSKAAKSKQLYQSLLTQKELCLSQLKHHDKVDIAFEYKERLPKETTTHVYKKLNKLYEIYPMFLESVIDYVVPKYSHMITNNFKVIGWAIYLNDDHHLRFRIEAKTPEYDILYYCLTYKELEQLKEKHKFETYKDTFIYTFELFNKDARKANREHCIHLIDGTKKDKQKLAREMKSKGEMTQ
jgi:hypothetical protein